MKLKLSDLNNGSIFIGDTLNIRTNFIFDDDEALLWTGLKLITKPPCGKELQINKGEIFAEGKFEAGEYIRERALIIRNVVPTIKKRNLEYYIQLIIRKQNPINPIDDIIIRKTHPIEIKIKESSIPSKNPNLVSISLSGLNINFNKDIFKPGESIKINYSSQEIKNLEVRLLQKANIICFCRAYGNTCRKVETLPPAIANSVKTSNFEKDFIILKIPEHAEITHNYLWVPSEKEFWGMKYGDYSKWSLLILGEKKPEFGGDLIKFEIPITITTKPLAKLKADFDFIRKHVSKTPSLFEEIPSKFQKNFKVVSIESDINKYIIRLKNISDENLSGVSVKILGLQSNLFETASSLVGFNSWKIGEEKEINYEIKQDISTLISIIEDNSQKTTRIQFSVSDSILF
jgi:hypothetical protein